VARSSYPDSVPKLERAGADRVVSPYTTSGMRMAALAMQPAVVDVLDMVTERGAEMSVEELMVPPAGADGLTAGDLRRSGATLLVVRARGGAISVGPADEHRLSPEDILVAMGTRDQLDALAGRLRPHASGALTQP